MKTRLLSVVCVLALTLGAANRTLASGNGTEMIVDTALVRPACFVATAVGSVAFVLSLPFAAISKSVHQTKEALVLKPAWATFTRPVGDFDSLIDY